MTERQPDEIRQTTAVYGEPELRHVEADRGNLSPLARLISSGRIKPAKLDLLRLGRPPDAPHEISISEALKEQRALGQLAG